MAIDDARLFFVVGLPKSGTSWLTNLLDSHPAILCRGEGRFFGTSHDLGTRAARSLQQTLRESTELGEWAGRSVWTRAADPGQVADELTASFVRSAMGEELAAAGRSLVGDKTPINGPPPVAEIGRLLPGARVVHIVRDGRDVAVSAVHHRWNTAASRGVVLQGADARIRDAYRADPDAYLASGQSLFEPAALEAAARTWSERVRETRAQGEALAAGYAEVRYEDLLADTAGELTRVCELLEVPVGAEQIAACVQANSFERLTGGRRPGEEDSLRFLRSGLAGDWRRVFTPADSELFAATAGDGLAAFGYEAR